MSSAGKPRGVDLGLSLGVYAYTAVLWPVSPAMILCATVDVWGIRRCFPGLSTCSHPN
ncbi:hypothetical protein PENSPDRAFT_652199 [Peniophora sp. CONT]|nr:hypothetical protein PENSPDRAFT_652199 [Peniophora sp. CONT]